MKCIPFFRIELLYRAFFKYIHWLHVTPNQDRRVGCLCYLKTTFCFVVVTFLFITDCRLRQSSLDLSTIFSYINALIMYLSYLRNHAWQCLYKNIEILGLSKENVKYTPFIVILLVLFFVLHLAGVFLLYLFIYMLNQKMHSIFESTILAVSPNLLYLYMLSITMLILVLIEEIRLQIKGATEHLNTNSMDVQTTKVMFFKARSLAILVNVKFGYELLAVFAQWLIYIIALSLSIAISIKTAKYHQSQEEPLWEIVIFFAISAVCTSVSDFIFNSFETIPNVFTTF